MNCWSALPAHWPLCLRRGSQWQLLAFPDEKQAKIYGVDQQGQRTEEFIDVVQLMRQQPQFGAYAKAILRMNEQRLASAAQLPEYDPELAMHITAGSYQIKTEEAQLIAAVLATLQGKGAAWKAGYQELFIDNDPLLGRPPSRPCSRCADLLEDCHRDALQRGDGSFQ